LGDPLAGGHAVRVAVIIAAYRAGTWIGQCLDAWEAVEVPDGWSADLRIGVDGCPGTRDTLNGTPHWWSPENVGPYLIRNSLIQLEPADAFAIFDADDLPHADYLAELLPMVQGGGIAGAARRTIEHTGEEVSAHYPYANGVCVISAQAWEALGGYRPWRVAADHDLIQRARAMGIPIQKHPRALYTRRMHPDSLTHHPEMGSRSPWRMARKSESRKLVQEARQGRGSFRVGPVTVELHR
jgi:hypothetical protein